MNKYLLLGIGFSFIFQIMAFLLYQASCKMGYCKYWWWIAIGGIPATLTCLCSIYFLMKGSMGEIWPSRLIGFGVGIVVFFVMGILMFHDVPKVKDVLCISFSILIIIIQCFWR